MKTLILKPGTTPGTFQAELEGKNVGKPTRQPLADGARTLLKQGLPAKTMITMQHYKSEHASFKPAKAGSWGAITYHERDRQILTAAKHRPFAHRGSLKKWPPA